MTKIITGMTIGIILIICMAAVLPDTKQYWQDFLAKPDQKWINQYGYSNESLLAYNTRRLYAFVQQQQGQVQELQKWVISQPQWTFADMNEPKYKLEKQGLKEPIIMVGDWSDPNNK